MCGSYHKNRGCCSGHHAGRRHHKTSGCNCGGHGVNRHYISPDEKIEQLEEYKEELKKEQAGVEARIKELKNR